MVVEKTSYILLANLRKSEDIHDTMEWEFQVFADDPFKAENMLRQWLSHPEQTGINYIECVGITPYKTKSILMGE